MKVISTNNSLLSASKNYGISYSRAWKILDNLNMTSEKPIIIKTRGGSGGGGAVVSEYGKLVLKEYELIKEEVSKFTIKLNNEINM
jgi:molybdate transport system regulatory protein